jgi:hypothetical protein
MPSISVCYANDKELLAEVRAALMAHVDAIEEPTEVESPTTLNLDPATVVQTMWQLLVAFGSIKASVEAVKIIVELLRKRAAKGKASKVEWTAAPGIKITLEGDMTPEQAAKAVDHWESALKRSFKKTSP